MAGPSNKNLTENNETIKNDPIIKTYRAQVQKKGYVQHDQADGFWTETGILNPVKKMATGEMKTFKRRKRRIKDDCGIH